MQRSRKRIIAAVSSVVFTVALLPGAAAFAATPTTAQQRATAFVNAAYGDFLGRAPTGSELQSATVPPPETIGERSRLVSALSQSTEWVGLTVSKLYADTLARKGDPGGMTYWTAKIQSHSLTVAAVAAAFYSSQEYFQLTGGTTSLWVTDLYTKILDRSVDQGGLTYWIARTDRVGRTGVAYSLYQSLESRNTRVTALYGSLLGRIPDMSGLAYWSNRVLSLGDLALASSLASSNEYADRASARSVPTPEAPTWTMLPSPLQEVAWKPSGISSAGLMVGTGPDGRGVTCSDPCTAPAVLPNPNHLQIKVAGVSPGGVIFGSGTADNSVDESLVWPDAQTAPTVLTAPAGSTNLSIVGVSAAGEVVGTARDSAGHQRGVVWQSVAAVPTFLANPSGTDDVFVAGVSVNGMIFGFTLTLVHAVTWTAVNAPATPLTEPGGVTKSTVVGVTSTGLIVGNGLTANGIIPLTWSSTAAVGSPVSSATAGTQISGVTPAGVAFGVDAAGNGLVWPTTNDAALQLPAPAGGGWTTLTGISAAGKITGSVEDDSGNVTEEVWASSTADPSPPTTFLGKVSVSVIGVAANGAVYGGASRGDGTYESIVWSTPTSVPIVLTQPSGTKSSRPVGIAPDGTILGSAWNDGYGSYEPVAWTSASATPSVLAIPPGFTNVSLIGAAGDGSVVGVGTVNSNPRPLAWSSPTANPTVMALPSDAFGAGLFGVNADGAIFGTCSCQQSSHSILVWLSATAAPVEVINNGPFSQANTSGISKTLLLVGGGMNWFADSLAYAWTSPWSGTITLHRPAGSTYAYAGGVSMDGLIVGAATDASGVAHVLEWTSPFADPVQLATPIGYRISSSKVSSAGTLFGEVTDTSDMTVGYVAS